MSNSKLKAKARHSLNDNYVQILFGILVLLISSAICLFIGKLLNTAWLAPALFFIVSSLLMMGFIEMIMKTSTGKKVKFTDIFNRTDLFFKYMGVTILLFLMGFLMWLLEIISIKSLIVIVQYQADLNVMLVASLMIFGALLSIAILVCAIYLSIAFSQVLFILHDNPDLKVTQVLGKSFDMMADYALEYFILCLSFIGWFILSLLTFGIVFIFAMPYVLVTLANFYNEIRKEYDSTSGDKVLDEHLNSDFEEQEIETLF